MDLKETDILGDGIARHWYYRSKARAMMRLLGKAGTGAVLDVGAGSGFFSRHLLAHSDVREAWCVDISYAQDSESQEAGKPLHLRRDIARVDAQLVLMMDVLEHVDDDVGLLRHYAAKVPARSQVLISVPAFQFLWSGHDVFLEHRRRYRLGQIEAVVREAGLQIERSAYYFGGVFPLAVASRLAERASSRARPQSQLRQHAAWVNGLLGGICALELPLMRWNRLAGLTAFCLARTH
ncbi:class I SAM-dependent methyltransferase [Verticiella sediminum]|uniref:Class I SAM-dependent methyltransferase n=1 Tax=Verticiella sediminum TaxID=1247510 RepID=A0A556ABI5_9BURK|nr:methyltransferase domain-containing protein [Verticiella sediminum]TSH90254.1 class I SAM-dependent methyltransferase [Verticiella sediminum]